MKTERRIEMEILARKLGITNFWNMKDATLSAAIEKAKKGEKVTEVADKPVEPLMAEPLVIEEPPAPTTETTAETVLEPIPEPMAKAMIELKGGFSRQKSIPVAEYDNFVENVFTKGFKDVKSGKVRVFSPNQIMYIDITGLPS